MTTIEELKTTSEVIRDASTVGENTAKRVGGLLCDMANVIGNMMDDVDALKTETLAVLDISSDYSSLDFGLSSENDKTENIKRCSAIKEGIYLLKKNESVHVDTVPETDNYMIAGIMFVFKDNMRHCLQELVITNELITTSSGTAHVDNYLFSRYRAWQNYNSPHSPRNAWSSWRDYTTTLFEQEQIESGVINGRTLTDNSVTAKKIANEAIEARHLSVPLYKELSKIAQIEDVINDYDNEGLLSFKGIAAVDANEALTSGIYPNITTNVPVAGQTYLVQTLRTTTAVYNQYYSIQIAIGTSAEALGKVYIRKNSQMEGSYTFGHWVDLTSKSGSPATISSDAKDISYDNSVSGSSATNVQMAIDDIYNQIGNVNEVLEKLLGV